MLTGKFAFVIARSTVPVAACVQVPAPFKLDVSLTDALLVYDPGVVISSKVIGVVIPE